MWLLGGGTWLQRATKKKQGESWIWGSNSWLMTCVSTTRWCPIPSNNHTTQRPELEWKIVPNIKPKCQCDEPAFMFASPPPIMPDPTSGGMQRTLWHNTTTLTCYFASQTTLHWSVEDGARGGGCLERHWKVLLWWLISSFVRKYQTQINESSWI